MVPSPKVFAQLFKRMDDSGRLSDIDKEMLRCHYEAPARTLTPRMMSQLMGWRGQIANSHYGRLARRVSEELQWQPDDEYHVYSLILGSRPGLDYVWKLRPQVARALELLRWVKFVFDDTENIEIAPISITERRKYRWHKSLERSSQAGRLAKEAHGYRCQVCDLSFKEKYGALGSDFIEVHHLVPLSTLDLDEARTYTINDFSVLCSNCHRMIHKWHDPSDLKGFKDILKKIPSIEPR
jgi:predicted HNH restriction endonuclease